MKNKYVSWRRVSTFKQGKSGLGLEDQKHIISYFVEHNGGTIIADYSECYTGTELSGCVELRKAIEHAKRTNAVLVIAKADRFRSTIEALQIYEEMGDGHIMFCDLPHTDKFTLTLFFALAEREALITSIRTTGSLRVLKQKGVKLGAASEKYKQTRSNKTNEQKEIENMKRGEMKRLHFQESRDTQTFLRVLRKVFPLATKAEQPDKWNWQDINVIGDNKANIIAEMKDYKEFDSEGKLFRKWDLTKDPHDRQQAMKLAAYIQRVRRSYVGS